MKGSFTWEHDTEEGETFDLLIEYEYVPYTPARITADPYYSEPADGGGCEEIIYKVTGYRQYDENLNVTLDLETLTPEKSKELTDKFEAMVNKDIKLEDRFHRLCCDDAERAMEPDYEDDYE
jgi:hypothetical protein